MREGGTRVSERRGVPNESERRTLLLFEASPLADLWLFFTRTCLEQKEGSRQRRVHDG